MWAPHVTAASSSATVMAPLSSNEVQLVAGHAETAVPNNNGSVINDNANPNHRGVVFNNRSVSISAQETIVGASTTAEDLQQLIDEMRKLI